jgi:hypothetical protein
MNSGEYMDHNRRIIWTLLGSGTTEQDIAVAEAGRDAVFSALKSSKT